MELKLTPRLLQDGDSFFGPGVAELMQQVQVRQSLRSAAASMGMAYSKAWRIIHGAEEALSCKLISSTIGGRNGGGATLTPEGEAFLAAYLKLESELTSYGQTRFEKLFKPWLTKS